jgi:hypothetical protein
MKKLLIVCFVLASVNSYSQGFVSGMMQKIHFGLKAGGNYSDFNNANFNTQGSYGFHAGMMIEYRFNERFSIHEDILFSSQATKLKDITTFGQDQIKLSYVSLPILFKYTTNIGLYFEAGPQANTNVGNNFEDPALKHYAKRLDYGVAGGLGYQTKVGLGIGLRYYAGLADVPDFQYGGINTKFTNNVAQASLFYIF